MVEMGKRFSNFIFSYFIVALILICILLVIIGYIANINGNAPEFLIAMVSTTFGTIFSGVILFIMVRWQINENNEKLDNIEENRHEQEILCEKERLTGYFNNIKIELKHNIGILNDTKNELNYIEDGNKPQVNISPEELLKLYQESSTEKKEQLKNKIDSIFTQFQEIYINSLNALSTNAYNDLMNSGLQKYVSTELIQSFNSINYDIKEYIFQSKIYALRISRVAPEEIIKDHNKFDIMGKEMVKKSIPDLINEMENTVKLIDQFKIEIQETKQAVRDDPKEKLKQETAKNEIAAKNDSQANSAFEQTPDANIKKDKALLKYFTDLRVHENELFWSKINIVLVIGAGLAAFLTFDKGNSLNIDVAILILIIGCVLSIYAWLITLVDNRRLNFLDSKVSEYSKSVFGIDVLKVPNKHGNWDLAVKYEARDVVSRLFSLFGVLFIFVGVCLWEHIDLLSNYIYTAIIIIILFGLALLIFVYDYRTDKK